VVDIAERVEDEDEVAKAGSRWRGGVTCLGNGDGSEPRTISWDCSTGFATSTNPNKSTLDFLVFNLL
jgi:hypothetical protein